MKSKFNEKAAYWPQNAHAQKALKKQIELGELGELDFELLPWPFLVNRYLVTYMKSTIGNRIRSSTVVSITNQSRFTNRVAVHFFRGLSCVPVGTCFYSIPSCVTVDFASRSIPPELTTVNCISTPALTFAEGRVVVSSMYPEIAVSSRVYYSEGESDSQLLAITDSKVVVYGKGNNGD